MRNRIKELFESATIAPQPHIKKIEVDDAKFYKILAAKPGDINTILARVSTLIKNDDPSKTKKQIIDEILEILDRSPATRLFVSIGLRDSYHIYKGFPVRQGEKFAKLPSQGQEVEMDKSGQFQSWITDPTSARKIATMFDPSKGDPIGGMLVDTHVDDSRLYFDTNAIIRTCKIKLQAIRNYNLKAAQGKAISNKNVDFLSSETDFYHDVYELLTDTNVTNVKVVDTWTWGSNKTPQWKSAQDAQNNTQEPQKDNVNV